MLNQHLIYPKLVHIMPNMNFQEHVDPGNQIKAYDKDYIQVDEQKYTQSILINKDIIEPLAEIKTIDQVEALQKRIKELKPNLVIIGSGQTQVIPEAKFTRFFLENKIGLEVMNTPAACRTYNVLFSEGRDVLAILIL